MKTTRFSCAGDAHAFEAAVDQAFVPKGTIRDAAYQTHLLTAGRLVHHVAIFDKYVGAQLVRHELLNQKKQEGAAWFVDRLHRLGGSKIYLKVITQLWSEGEGESA